MIPSVDLIRVKICLIAPFSMSYPDVVIAYRTYKKSGKLVNEALVKQ